MDKVFLILGVIIILIVAVGGSLVIKQRRVVGPTPTLLVSPRLVPSMTPQASPPLLDSPAIAKRAAVHYPMERYNERITNRGYGKTIVPSDNQGLACGAAFSGLHTGDDLEVLAHELTSDVPVYSIAAGIVRQVRTVSGYGGLIVVEHVLDGETVTAYYGHVDAANAAVSVGEEVMAGQRLTALGEGCSAETDGERKHLHFSIRRGTTIDVKGYVATAEQLRAWLNPQQTLSNLTAQEPG